MDIKVLIVDDDEITRRMLAKSIESLGYTPVTRTDGKKAWDALYEYPEISLVITDLLMPDMDGRELVELIRSSHSNPDLPILIVSGVIDQSEIEDLLEKHPAAFCKKPFDADIIKSETLRLLKASLH